MMPRVRSYLRRGAAPAVIGALAAVSAGSGAAAQPYSGEDFLAALSGGAVWCVDYRLEDRSCAFVLTLFGAGDASSAYEVEFEGVALTAYEDGGFAKVVQRFRYEVVNDQVCLRGDEVAAEDIEFYDPATDAPYVAAADARVPSSVESGLRGVVVDDWAARGLSCWSYRIEERAADLPGPELVMTRFSLREPAEDVGFGVFFAADDLERLRLRP